MTNISNFGKGCLKAPKDPRNYLLEQILGVGEFRAFNWNLGFDIEEKTGKLKIENQNGSSSCVAQSVSKYLEVLNILEEGFIDLSAKDIYSRIFAPQGGAYIPDAFKLAVKRGVVKESSNPSYELLTEPPSEQFMRELLPTKDEEAYIYASKSYATTTHNDIEFIAQMIRDNNGLVSGFIGSNAGWGGIEVRPPLDGEPIWGHALYLGRAKIRNGKKMIGFLNSWGDQIGEGGWQWFGEDYLGRMFDIWTLIDRVNSPNQNNMLVDEKLLVKLYQLVFKRMPDADAVGYIGKDISEVLDSFLMSNENLAYTRVYQEVKNIEKNL